MNLLRRTFNSAAVTLCLRCRLCLCWNGKECKYGPFGAILNIFPQATGSAVLHDLRSRQRGHVQREKGGEYKVSHLSRWPRDTLARGEQCLTQRWCLIFPAHTPANYGCHTERTFSCWDSHYVGGGAADAAKNKQALAALSIWTVVLNKVLSKRLHSQVMSQLTMRFPSIFFFFYRQRQNRIAWGKYNQIWVCVSRMKNRIANEMKWHQIFPQQY